MSWQGNRREFLRLLATVGAGATASCNKPKTQYLRADFEAPEDKPPGLATYYATTCRECPAGCGVWARTLAGRVVKLEGNPDHPTSHGALCARGQAALQGLYNPDRVTRPLARGDDGELHEVSWEEALLRLHEAVARPIAQGRPQGVAWLTGETSDSDADLIELIVDPLRTRDPVNLRLLPDAPLAAAASRLFGYSGAPEFRLAEATMLVAFGADFAESWKNPVQQIFGFTQMHAYRHDKIGRAVYVGPRQSTTAAICDTWIPLAPGREAAALRVLIEAILLRKQDIPPDEAAAAHALLETAPLADAEQAIGTTAAALRKLGEDFAASSAPLAIASGLGADSELAQTLALLATHLAGGSERTIAFPSPARSPRGDSIEKVRRFFEDADTGGIEVVLVHNADPMFLHPKETLFSRTPKFIVSLTTQLDETATRADLVLPIHHSLESWGDHAAAAGVVGLLQPAMRPLFGTRAFADLVLSLAGSLREHLKEPLPWQDTEQYFEARLETYYRALESPLPLDAFKRDAKKRGGIWSKVAGSPVRLRSDAKLPALLKSETGFLAHVFPHPFLYDGRGADKSWLQEVPETSTAIVWGSWAEIHPDTARELNVRENDSVAIARGTNEITVPIHVTSQVMPGVVAVPIGQGHEHLGRWASPRGANPLALTDLAAAQGNLALSGFAVSIRAKHGAAGPLIRTSGSEDQGDRRLAQAVSIVEARQSRPHQDNEPSLYPKHDHPEHEWAMVIDLDACVGCGACVVACYAENNVAVVGPKIVGQGREMSWIRVEKYVEGDRVRLLLNLCQHCHHAPCEAVCPVHAAYHTTEGLNAQVYNRCVGTRYCSNNCPYKVRRFNWFDYRFAPPLPLQLNPNVTVRERGMMEKCTFCVQRIREAKERAKNEGRAIRDGEVTPACAQTCPAKAIAFGDLKDPTSRVSTLGYDPRGYHLLGELGTRPSVTYLKKVLRGREV